MRPSFFGGGNAGECGIGQCGMFCGMGQGARPTSNAPTRPSQMAYAQPTASPTQTGNWLDFKNMMSGGYNEAAPELEYSPTRKSFRPVRPTSAYQDPNLLQECNIF